MKYSIITCTDGNNIVRAEGITDLESAKKTFHHWCELLMDDKSFTYGMIKLMDENLDCVEGKMELINRRQPEPEPVEPEEPVEEITEGE